MFDIHFTVSLKDPNEEALELATPTDPVVELLKQGAGKNYSCKAYFVIISSRGILYGNKKKKKIGFLDISIFFFHVL